MTLLGVLAVTPVMAATPGPVTKVFSRATPAGEVRIAARVMGQGPLVVLVPSLGRGASDFDELMVQLAEAGFMAASVDPRGIGQSRGPTDGLTLFDYADDVAMVARGLSDRPAVFVGHALGNRIVRAAASRHPEQVSRLVLLAAGGQVPIAPAVLKALNGVFEGLPADQHLEAVRLAFFAPGNDPAIWRGGWHPAVARQQQVALAATPSEQWTGGGSTPILIVQAQDDTVAPPANAEALVKAYPGRVQVSVLPHAGHAMLPEQPAAIAEILIGYLKTGKPPAAP
ncbi:alpha/beta hydrolase [Phenylobacterium sp.]|jgi:pimeloyl-ACP methyl ester carboxylesterase|uniref:alpha/beta fold hydrolase n=1 Tax=Phenylobacterium sp. TaxID=1871053 RepID=UPI002F9249AF